jgi:hypothetical protein
MACEKQHIVNTANADVREEIRDVRCVSLHVLQRMTPRGSGIMHTGRMSVNQGEERGVGHEVTEIRVEYIHCTVSYCSLPTL